MRIAIDISPIDPKSKSAHKVRGVGRYISLLLDNVQKYDKDNKYLFFSGKDVPKNVDLVHYPYFDPFTHTLPNKKQGRIAVTVHDLTPIVFKKHFPSGVRGGINWFIQKKRLKNADIILTDSESSKKDILKICGIPSQKIEVVYLAVDDNFRVLNSGGWENEVRKKYKLPEKYLLYVGDATWNKNLPALIEAVKRSDQKLVIVGKVWEQKLTDVKDNPWNNDLKKVLSKIEGDEKFVNLGFVEVEDLVKIYNLATLLVMPSIYEGFGLPILEAMSCGCPVLSSKGGSLPEVGKSASYYTNGYEAEDILEGINMLTSNKELLKSLSVNGVKNSKEFSTKKFTIDTANVYKKLND